MSPFRAAATKRASSGPTSARGGAAGAVARCRRARVCSWRDPASVTSRTEATSAWLCPNASRST